MKKLLYIFDNINYMSGSQRITLYQIELLKEYYNIDILSLTEPNKESLAMINKKVGIIGQNTWKRSVSLNLSLKDALKSSQLSLMDKCYRLIYSICNRFSLNAYATKYLLSRDTKKALETYDTVIVVSEASRLREYVSQLKNPRKIQWIHTDYSLWSSFSKWTESITKNDSKIYRKFDAIITLTEINKKSLLSKLPMLQDKIHVIPNLIQGDYVQQLSRKKCDISFEENTVNLVSIGRIDHEKAYLRTLVILEQLLKSGYDFHWYIIGDGPLEDELMKKIYDLGMENHITLLGFVSNPYPILKQADFFVLLSEYEGSPLTIHEAMVLNVPVIATNVGGIREQLQDYGHSILVENNVNDICDGLKRGLNDKKQMKKAMENVINFDQYNQRVKDRLITLL